MRVNIYAEELTDRVEIISKTINGHEFTGLRIYLELPVTLPREVYLSGGTRDVEKFQVTNEGYADTRRHVKGPFLHAADDDDDSSAVTFWGKSDLRDVLKQALEVLDKHYAHRKEEAARRDFSCTCVSMIKGHGRCTLDVNPGSPAWGFTADMMCEKCNGTGVPR